MTHQTQGGVWGVRGGEERRGGGWTPRSEAGELWGGLIIAGRGGEVIIL